MFLQEDKQMPNKHMRSYSMSLIIGEMQVKTAMRYQFTPSKKAIMIFLKGNAFYIGR